MKTNLHCAAFTLVFCLLGTLQAPAFFDPTIGRWASRDPMGEEAGMNCYSFLRSEPIGGNDYLGLWDSRIHRDATQRWASEAGYPSTAAERVGEADDAVDSAWGATSFITEPGTQYHFDRSYSMGLGEDTRMIKYREHLGRAEAFCTSSKGFDYPEAAAWHLGTALHPYQDWVAHGHHNYFLTGNFGPLDIHNLYGRARGSRHYPDDPSLDAVGSSDGRPTLNVLKFSFLGDGRARDWARYEPGQKRLQLTYSMSSSSLRQFREYVRAHGSCLCKKYFGVE